MSGLWAKLRRQLLCAAVLLLIAAACGGNGDATEHSHEHSGAEVVEWEGPLPQIEVVVEATAGSGLVARAVLDGFTLTSPEVTEHVPGEGHLHVLIDGQPYLMLYEPEVELPDLEPGVHEIRMTLSRNDHLDYGLEGVAIGASAHLEVPGTPEPADVVVTARYFRGEVLPEVQRVVVADGSLVEMRVTSDVAEVVHVHGYDLLVVVEPGREAILRFAAEVRGIFEVEMEDSGELLVELVVE